MEHFIINGNKPLGGSAKVHGAKNAVLPILAAAVLIDGETVLHNCPKLSDVDNTLKILKSLGANVKREGSTLIINSAALNNKDIEQRLMREMRSSVLFLGALSSRFKTSCVTLPGGCDIGKRPVDLHLKALADLSASVSISGGKICCNAENAKAGDIVFPYPSVGATENAILASVFLSGKTRIINAAREPEIADLCNLLNKAGADIKGASTSVIEINGVEKLHTVEHTVLPDRILAVTLMCAAAITKSTLKIKCVNISDFKSELPVFKDAGCKLYLTESTITVQPPQRLKRIKSIVTKPYPGFSTDCQAPVCAMLSVANGSSGITETVFENRFAYINELSKFGADISVKGNKAYIKGVKSLSAADACCTDLRGGAALVLAALCAEGKSRIFNINHIDRGYEQLENQLTRIGADIVRFKDEKKRKPKSKNGKQAAASQK